MRDLAKQNDAQKLFFKWLKPCHMGTHQRVLSESYPMNTNMTRFRWFSKVLTLRPCTLGESSLSTGKVKGEVVRKRRCH